MVNIINHYPNYITISPVAQETGVQFQVNSYERLKKWYLVMPCLKLSIYKVTIKGKVEQSKERTSVLPYTSV